MAAWIILIERPDGRALTDRMGLDGVELVMAFEEEFGIAFTNAEAERIETVGKAIDVIFNKLQETDSVSAENLVLGAVARVSGERLENLDRSTRLDEVFSTEARWDQWDLLQQELGYEVVPGPRLPWALTLLGWCVVFLPIVLLWPRIGWGIIVGLAAGFSYWLLVQRFRCVLPLKGKRVGDLIKPVEKRLAKSREKQGLSRSEVRAETVEIIVEQLGITPEQCTDDARFIDDLGVG